MKISKKIEELLIVNNYLWHEATEIKDFDNKPKQGLSSEKRVQHFLKIRELNSDRSTIRAELDSIFNDGVDETKLNYHGGENA